MRFLGIVLAAGILAGCAGDLDGMSSYIGVPGTRVTTAQDQFTVHDRRRAGRMMVVASTRSSLGDDFDGGRPIGTTGAGIPRNYFGDAARAHLNQTGRGSCTITGLNKVINSQYEVAYSCG